MNYIVLQWINNPKLPIVSTNCYALRDTLIKHITWMPPKKSLPIAVNKKLAEEVVKCHAKLKQQFTIVTYYTIIYLSRLLFCNITYSLFNFWIIIIIVEICCYALLRLLILTNHINNILCTELSLQLFYSLSNVLFFTNSLNKALRLLFIFVGV